MPLTRILTLALINELTLITPSSDPHLDLGAAGDGAGGGEGGPRPRWPCRYAEAGGGPVDLREAAHLPEDQGRRGRAQMAPEGTWCPEGANPNCEPWGRVTLSLNSWGSISFA